MRALRFPLLLLLLTVSTAVLPDAAGAQVTNCIGCSGVAVTPDGAYEEHLPNTGPWTVIFTVQNLASSSQSFSFSCASTGGVTCGTVDPASATIGAGGSVDVSVDYTLGSSSGTLVLSAEGSSFDSGDYTIGVIPPPSVNLVLPHLTSGSRAVVRTRTPRVLARFTPGGAPIDTSKTLVIWRRGAVYDTVTRWQADSLTIPHHNRGVLEWELDSLRGLNAATAADSGQLTVTICDTNLQCASVSRWLVLPGDNAPVLGFSSIPPNSWGGGFASPLGPGINVSGAEIETGFSTIPYLAMGAGRSAGLVYSTRQSYPRVLVPVDVELRTTGTPAFLVVRLKDGSTGTTLDTLKVTSPNCSTGSAKRCRVVLQGDLGGTAFATPARKWLQVEVQDAGVGTTSVDSVEVVLVDRRTTRFGSGWWPSAFTRLIQAGEDRLLVGPNGSAVIFRGTGDSVYLPPPGGFTGLTITSTGWALRAAGDSGVTRFDIYGRVAALQDANGNKDSLVYGGTGDSLLQLRDPTGHTITFGYTGGKLSTITDAGSRQTRVSIDGTNQLVYDSLSSPATRPYVSKYTYQAYTTGANTSLLLTKWMGTVLDTTVVAYDGTRRRPTQATLPRVTDPAGAPVLPIIGYTPMEARGLGALVSLDSAYVQVTDPRGNWTKSLATRFRSLSWDAIGIIGRSAFAADGRLLWSEGKKGGDTTRVHYGYDARQRPVKSWIVRIERSGSILRSDSLVYDANSRVVKRVDARGQVDSVVYDAKGNVTASRDKAGNWTTLHYRTDGLLDTLRLPGDTVSYNFTYDATWKHRLRTLRGQGPAILLDTLIFDGLGRPSVSFDRVRSRKDSMAWRRTTTYYNAASQVDSVVNEKSTTNCLPCTNPSGLTFALEQRVSKRYDAAGRDSVRLNARGKATVYLYDRLGRLLTRTPPGAGTPPSDRMVYDVAGNLVKVITRRGDTITTNYDTRNRDTLSIIPGVGTLRRAYAGPLDQLTRVWFSARTDSIGGVTGDVAYGYDNRGRLTADTAWTDSIPRPTAYTYDFYERDSLRVDPVGTWRTGYDDVRGYANKLVTPFSDSLEYALDAQGRATTAPRVRSSGPTFLRSLSLSLTSGSLTVLTNTSGTWNAGSFDPEPASENGESAPLAPVWTEQHGSLAGNDSVFDGSGTDSWGRVQSWTQVKNGVLAGAEAYAFDSTGNASGGPSSSMTFDATTDRLTNRLDAATGYSWTYTYDNAGNQIQAAGTKTGQPTLTWTYGYDALNQLRSVRYNGTLIARYGYDVLGRRIANRVYSSTTGGVVAYRRFVYAGSQVAFETDSLGAMKTRYTWGADVDDLVALTDSGGPTYYAVQDGLRSVRGLVKQDGTWIMSQRFTPYGTRLARDTAATAQPTLRYGWTGREYDPETGFYFMRARYYDPGQLRFTQEDPIGYEGGANVYGYVSGDVLGSRDPSGLDPRCNLSLPLGSPGGCWALPLPELEVIAERGRRVGGWERDPHGGGLYDPVFHGYGEWLDATVSVAGLLPSGPIRGQRGPKPDVVTDGRCDILRHPNCNAVPKREASPARREFNDCLHQGMESAGWWGFATGATAGWVRGTLLARRIAPAVGLAAGVLGGAATIEAGGAGALPAYRTASNLTLYGLPVVYAVGYGLAGLGGGMGTGAIQAYLGGCTPTAN